MSEKPARPIAENVKSETKSSPPRVPLSSSPTSTEEIDDDWGATPEPPAASVSPGPPVAEARASEPLAPSIDSKPPVTDEVDSGWLGDSESEKQSALEAPIFPADPRVPAGVGVRASAAREAPSERTSQPSQASRSPGSSPPVSSNSSTPGYAGAHGEPPVSRKSVEVGASTVAAATPHKARSRSLLPLAATLMLAGLLIWFLRSAEPGAPEPEVSRPAEPRQAPLATAAAPPAAAVSDTPAASAAPSKEGSEAPEAGALPNTEARPEPSAAAPAPSVSADNVSVVVHVRPLHARIFRHGKEVGKPPVTVELAPGERRFFEVGAPGYRTRKVIVDGTSREMIVGLRPVEPLSGAPIPSAN